MNRAKEGKVNKQVLMRGASPYNDAAKRKLDDAEWEIDGSYSIEFDSCISLMTQNDDLFDDEDGTLAGLAESGMVKSETSYITFTVIGSSETMTFITDVATYFNALSQYLPDKVDAYCEGCKENEDYCDGTLEAQMADEAEEDEAEEEEEEAEEGDEGERKKRRKLANGRTVEYIDCSKCEAYTCFDEEEEEGEERKLEEEVYEMDDAIEWLNGLAECAAIEDAVYGDYELYAGLMCNQEGNGVEIGVFFDEECSLYTTAKSYYDIMPDDAKTYYYMTQDIVQYTFTNTFPCEQVEVEYINPYTEQEDEEEEEEDDGEAAESSEYCNALFDNTVSMSDCGMDADEQEDAEEDDGEYDENLSTYSWYTYEITQEDAEDAASVCAVLKGWDESAGKSGSYKGKTVYEKGSSGTLYNYKKKNSSTGNGAGGIAAIVVFVVIAVGAVGAFIFSKKSSNPKKTPLINANTQGQMA